MNNDLISVVAIDVGGSSVKSGAVTFDGSVTSLLHTPIDSQASKDDVLHQFVNIIKKHLDKINQDALIGIAFGFPGPFDYMNGVSYIQGQSKYDDLYQVNIRDELKKRLKFKNDIRFCNDAEAAIVGEANFGAGKGFNRVFGITLGTGLGAGFVVNGISIHKGTGIPPNAELFPLTFKGIRADDLFSTRGLLVRFQNLGHSYSAVAEATTDIKHGNTVPIQVFNQFGEDLGRFLRPIAEDFSAEILIVLGGIAGAFTYFRDPLEDHLDIPVVNGNIQNAALLGAATLLFKDHYAFLQGN
ncbi:MAG: ROK family protein [Desulfobacterales bacterium]|nr:MAG: ROK family protein [Desulfobacterales bacterium]